MIRLLAALVLSAGLSGIAFAVATPPDEIIIKYRSPSRHANHGKVTRRQGNHLDVVKVDDVDGGQSDESKSHRLRQRLRTISLDANVLYAEPNYRGRFEEASASIPNDADYANQWWLPAVGDRAMWALGRGSGLIVAVIDSGIDLNHPDLAPNLLPNGYNFGDGNANPQDVYGHGTKVAGIIAARQNNGVGVSGLAPEAMILPIKINVGGQSTFSSDQLASAIAYAVDQGSKIINLSLTVDQQTQTVQEAIQSALDHGVIVVAAAGNSGGAVQFPATMPGVFAVAATDQSGRLAPSSNAGPEILIAAPGANILSTALGGGVVASNPGGTSFAAPIVTATIADMLSINPSLAASVISSQLRGTSTVIGDGQYSFGSVDAGAAGNSLVPHLQLSSQQFSSVESVSVNFSLPPTGAAVDLYVAVQTPAGCFFLLADGSWLSVAETIAKGYSSDKGAAGALFGFGAPFPSIALRDFPSGTYTWAIGMLLRSSGKLIGNIMLSSMILQ